MAKLEKSYGKNPASWPAWGDQHGATFRNETLGKSGIAPIEALFNRGPFRTAGGQSLVNATGWSASASFEVEWLPSMRMIVDLADLSRSLTVHTTGESGHAFAPHYIDLAPLWAKGAYYPMLWGEKDIAAATASSCALAP
jgi:penicillin amidase